MSHPADNADDSAADATPGATAEVHAPMPFPATPRPRTPGHRPSLTPDPVTGGRPDKAPRTLAAPELAPGDEPVLAEESWDDPQEV